MRDAAIVAHDVVVDHQTVSGMVRALECADLIVAGGTSLAVMGPSGCGKSTLLGLLAGLALPSRGTVNVGGANITGMSPRERVRFRRTTLGMVCQADNLLPHLTIEENVAMQLAIARRDGGTSGGDPQGVLGRLGLDGLQGRLPDHLSGGQRQRAAVARAVIHRPAIILADEPTGSLDADAARIVIELLIEVQREIGATMVMVTHDPEIAARADRTVQLARPGEA
jgi:putative ABC transport system ATP-binding protein